MHSTCYQEDYDVLGRRVDADGDLLGSELTPASDSSDQTYPDVAYDEAGGGYAVVWQHSSDVHGTILDHAGAVMGGVLPMAVSPQCMEMSASAGRLGGVLSFAPKSCLGITRVGRGGRTGEAFPLAPKSCLGAMAGGAVQAHGQAGGNAAPLQQTGHTAGGAGGAFAPASTPPTATRTGGAFAPASTPPTATVRARHLPRHRRRPRPAPRPMNPPPHATIHAQMPRPPTPAQPAR